MRVVGVILILLGILGFIFGGISFTRDEKVADIGPIEIEQERTDTVPIAPIAAGVAVVAGIALVALGGSRRTL